MENFARRTSLITVALGVLVLAAAGLATQPDAVKASLPGCVESEDEREESEVGEASWICVEYDDWWSNWACIDPGTTCTMCLTQQPEEDCEFGMVTVYEAVEYEGFEN